MSVINAVPLLAAAGGDYTISRSVRLRSSAGAYFNRSAYPVASAGTQWTMSMWVKRGAFGTNDLFSFVATTGAAQQAGIQFDANDAIRWWQYAPSTYQFHKITTAIFRDPSAWYHLVFIYDTTLATAEDRCQVWVNGVRQTSFSTNINPSQNLVTYYKTGQLYPYIGAENRNASSVVTPFDGYLTEVNFIDGQALTPSSFGETDAATGVWKPKKYAGTYGTNGFYLNFSDNSNNTAATIGKDYSGNGNNWTPNNISVTSGTTYDSMLDVPTPYADGGNGRGNYAVLNPLGGSAISNLTISNANLTVTTPIASSSNFFKAACSIAVSTGKWYFEDTVTAVNTNNWAISISGAAPLQDSSNQNGLSTGEVTYFAYASSFETIYVNGSATFTGSAAASVGDVIGVAFDADARTIQFYRNNSAVSTAQTINSASTYFISLLVRNNTTASIHNANFGQRPFAYPPSGFKALNTQNLPEPTIKKGNQYFDVSTWTGTNSTGSRTITGLAFQPDLVWGKDRTSAFNHQLYDSVRGTGKSLASSSTSAEDTTNISGYISSFNSDGFTATVGSTDNWYWNKLNDAYAAWQWKAGNSSSSNTSGSITSTVSVNATAGFSVVTYTGNATNGATVGHGLGVAPAMVIVKDRVNAYNWTVYHKNLTSAEYVLLLNSTSGQLSSSQQFNSTAPSSSVITLGWAGSDNNTNATTTHVAYCFSAVAGYSAFGSYTGNGNSSDGPFVYLGFRPRWIMVKSSTSVTDWKLLDTSRNPYNSTNSLLGANISAAEDTNTAYDFDILSNGFKIRNAFSYANTNGATYIYACFAENPFKLALAR